QLALALAPRHQADLENVLGRLYDPQDPLYGQFLTSEQFQAYFSPTQAQYEMVAAFARSRGLAVVGTHPNRLLLDVAGPAAVVERAFATRLTRFQSVTGRVFRAPAVEPAIPAALAGQVTGVLGLDDLGRARPHLVRPATQRSGGVMEQWSD